MAAILKISLIQKNFKLPTPQSLGSGFLSVDGNGISVLAIMKKLKNGYHFININHTENFEITDPPKFGSLVFQVSTFKTFVYGHLCMVTFWYLENWRCKFSIDSIF